MIGNVRSLFTNFRYEHRQVKSKRSPSTTSNFVFCHFWQKFENSKWPPFLGRGTCLKIGNSTFLDTLWVKNFDEIALSHTVKEIQAILCFRIFGKNSKIQNGRHFWGGENFLKIAKSTFLRYPEGRKFRRNRSMSHG